jgi:hypothetical protein
MAGKTGKKSTGRKPEGVRRQSAQTDGASGRESGDRVKGKRRTTQLDKATANRLTDGSGGVA